MSYTVIILSLCVTGYALYEAVMAGYRSWRIASHIERLRRSEGKS